VLAYRALNEERERQQRAEGKGLGLKDFCSLLFALQADTLNPMSTHTPLVGVIMGSKSDWETMQHTAQTLTQLAIPHEVRVVSAHRTPDLLFEYASTAEERGLKVIIAGAGGAAHLPGMTAAKTSLPVLGVPVESKTLKGMDSLLSIVQMPAGIPVATLAIGKAGAINAALLAASILGNEYEEISKSLKAYREAQTRGVLENSDPTM
jgi:5-(carboxyamino)imidazole ribonucleotide mutase